MLIFGSDPELRKIFGFRPELEKVPCSDPKLGNISRLQPGTRKKWVGSDLTRKLGIFPCSDLVLVNLKVGMYPVFLKLLPFYKSV